jgi:phosphate transport system substrate-binding protein
MLRKVCISLIVAASLTGCGEDTKQEGASTLSQKKSLVLKGSDTVLPLGQKEAEEFMKNDSAVSLTVVGGGTGVGVAALMDGTTDIAMASRELKTDEKLKFSEKKIDLAETVIAYDALMVIVHPDNQISQLTREDISDIFTGKTRNWKELGGPDEKIIAYSRESSSGTYEFFKEHVLKKKNYAPTVLSMPATGAIVQSVSQTKGAIGYVGLAYENKQVKTLAVSYDKGKTYVSPSIAAAKDKTYPISRPLFFLYNKAQKEKLKTFIDFVLSPTGQKVVADIGYVPCD